MVLHREGVHPVGHKESKFAQTHALLGDRTVLTNNKVDSCHSNSLSFKNCMASQCIDSSLWQQNGICSGSKLCNRLL
jgi:hypothetical protein